MRIRSAAIGAISATVLNQSSAFNTISYSIQRKQNNFAVSGRVNLFSIVEEKQEQDCGCDIQPIFSGKISDEAKTLDPFSILTSSQAPIYELSGRETSLSKVLPSKSTSVVVFLRSFG